MNRYEIPTYTTIDKFWKMIFFPNMKSVYYSYEGFHYDKVHKEIVNAALKFHEKFLTEYLILIKEMKSKISHRKTFEKGNFRLLMKRSLSVFLYQKC